MGNEIHRGDAGAPKHIHAGDPDKWLVNHPQLAKNAINQEEIDRLMEEK